MSDTPYKVTIIVDPEFGDRLQKVEPPVWIADTPVNRAAAERVWSECPEESHLNGVTTFQIDLNLTADEWCAGILSAVDLHHGEYSHRPPYSVVEVIGTRLTIGLRQAFSKYGLKEFVKGADGFRARGSK
ncbi:MAG: hypothetical protein ND895_07435 [Pyrinomonadaceae bacterium]|nr:hypothetical protein [Pyrinomonadaceae bacterium]